MCASSNAKWIAPIVIGMLTAMFHNPDVGGVGSSVDRPTIVNIAGLPSGRPIKGRGDHSTNAPVVCDTPVPSTSTQT